MKTINELNVSMMNQTGPTKVRGFTLAEVLTVVVILAIAATIVIPMMGDTNDMKAASASRQIVSTLLYAQTLAIASQQKHQVVFDTGNNRYEIRDESGNTVADPVNPSQPYRVNYANHPQLQPVAIAGADFGGTNTVCFDTIGRMVEGVASDNLLMSQGTISIQAGSEAMQVLVEPVSGRIHIAE